MYKLSSSRNNLWRRKWKYGTLITSEVQTANVLQTTGAAVSVTDESDFEFDASTGTITKYIGYDSIVVIPSNVSNKSLTWKSSNTAVAIVDASGKVTAVAAGAILARNPEIYVNYVANTAKDKLSVDTLVIGGCIYQISDKSPWIQNLINLRKSVKITDFNKLSPYYSVFDNNMNIIDASYNIIFDNASEYGSLINIFRKSLSNILGIGSKSKYIEQMKDIVDNFDNIEKEYKDIQSVISGIILLLLLYITIYMGF